MYHIFSIKMESHADDFIKEFNVQPFFSTSVKFCFQ